MITQTVCNSFKKGLLEGKFDFSSTTTQTFKIALYTPSATLDANTAQYTTTNESTGAGYTAGGQALTITVHPTVSVTTAYISFGNVTWTATTLLARGALIYKADGITNPAIAVVDFGEDKQTNSGNFVIDFPLADAAYAIVKLA